MVKIKILVLNATIALTAFGYSFQTATGTESQPVKLAQSGNADTLILQKPIDATNGQKAQPLDENPASQSIGAGSGNSESPSDSSQGTGQDGVAKGIAKNKPEADNRKNVTKATTLKQPVAEIGNAVSKGENAGTQSAKQREKSKVVQPSASPRGSVQEAASGIASESDAENQSKNFDRKTGVNEVPPVNAEKSAGGKLDQPTAEIAPPAAVIRDNLSAAEKKKIAEAEKKKRERKHKRRNELIGAAAAGVAIGVIVNELGGKVVGDEGDRLVIEREGRMFIRKDENERLREDGSIVRNETLPGGHMRTIVTRTDGIQIITVRDAGGFIIRRTKVLPNGKRIVLIDSQDVQPTQRMEFDRRLPPVKIGIDRDRYVVDAGRADRRILRETLEARPVESVERPYTLREIRDSERIRQKVRRIDLDTITFETGSYLISRSQIYKLEDLGKIVADIIDRDPDEIFLVEGHTDAVGSDLSNLILSDRRAETVAQILSDYYDVLPENMVVQGYGEQHLKIPTDGPEKANRRVTIRRITPLLRASR